MPEEKRPSPEVIGARINQLKLESAWNRIEKALAFLKDYAKQGKLPSIVAVQLGAILTGTTVSKETKKLVEEFANQKRLAQDCLEALQMSNCMMGALVDGVHDHPDIESAPVFRRNEQIIQQLEMFLAHAESKEFWCKGNLGQCVYNSSGICIGCGNYSEEMNHQNMEQNQNDMHLATYGHLPIWYEVDPLKCHRCDGTENVAP